MKKRVIFYYVLELFFLILIVFSSIKIFNWYKDNQENKNIMNNLNKYIKVTKTKNRHNNEIKNIEYKIDFDSLKKKNSDTVAYIKVNGTNINYPVLKTNDNEFYLHHNFEKKSNVAGWIFANYLNKFDGNDKNITLFGHNMRDKSMFGSLKDTLKSDWYKNSDNLNITLITENKEEKYQVFSNYKIEKEEYYLKNNFKSDNEYKEFLNKLKTRSIYNYNVTLNEKSKILTLSTCDNNNKFRVVLHAVKID